MPKAIWELAGYSSMKEWQASFKNAASREPRANELTAMAADRRAKGKWFGGYCEIVAHARDERVTGDLAIEGRHVLYEGGLVVSGTLSLGDSRSIVVVVGDLEVGKLVLGDDVLVVTGRITAKKGIVSRRNEGIFSVHGEQSPDKQLRWLRAPSYVAYDLAKRELVTYRAKAGKLVRGR